VNKRFEFCARINPNAGDADNGNDGSITFDPESGGTESQPINVIQANPAIDIRKQAEGVDSRQFLSGADVDFEIAVTNTGNVDLTNVTVTDALVPDCDNVIGDLAVGQTVVYACTVTNVTADFTNVAKVMGRACRSEIRDDNETPDLYAKDVRAKYRIVDDEKAEDNEEKPEEKTDGSNEEPEDETADDAA